MHARGWRFSDQEEQRELPIFGATAPEQQYARLPAESWTDRRFRRIFPSIFEFVNDRCCRLGSIGIAPRQVEPIERVARRLHRPLHRIDIPIEGVGEIGGTDRIGHRRDDAMGSLLALVSKGAQQANHTLPARWRRGDLRSQFLSLG